MAEAVRHDKTARQLRLLSDALDSGRLGPVRRLVNTLSPAEIGNLLESLPPGSARSSGDWSIRKTTARCCCTSATKCARA